MTGQHYLDSHIVIVMCMQSSFDRLMYQGVTESTKLLTLTVNIESTLKQHSIPLNVLYFRPYIKDIMASTLRKLSVV